LQKCAFFCLEPRFTRFLGFSRLRISLLERLSSITVNVAQATGTFTAPAALSTTYTPTLKLSDVPPPANYAWVTPATTITAAGNNQPFPAKYTDPSGNYLAANGNITVNVAQATGLENDAPPVREISASNTNPHQYDLTLLAFKQKDHGAQTYELGELKGTTSILAAKPSLGTDGHTITYTGTGKETGEATLEIIVKSANYTNTTATITFKATKKEEVTIGGITLVPTYAHDGTPKSGYDGTPAGTNASTGAPYTGEFLIEWAGTNLPQGTTPPTQPGEYTVKISLKDPNYTGVWSKQFTITEPTDPIRLPQVASNPIRIKAISNAIMLENLPSNAKVEVYNLQGKRIYSAYPENPQILRIGVQTKGMYIVKAGNQTLRVAVK